MIKTNYSFCSSLRNLSTILLLIFLTATPFSSCFTLPAELQETAKVVSPIASIITSPLPCFPKLTSEGFIGSYTNYMSVDTCNEMTRKLNNAAPSSSSSCPWEYYCHFQANRFPQYIVQANCSMSHCQGCSSSGSFEPGNCEAVTIPLDVYKCSASEVDPLGIPASGEWIKEEIQVACQCEHSVIESQ